MKSIVLVLVLLLAACSELPTEAPPTQTPFVITATPLPEPAEVEEPTEEPVPEVIVCSDTTHFERLAFGYVPEFGGSPADRVDQVVADCIYLTIQFESGDYLIGRLHADGRHFSSCTLFEVLANGDTEGRSCKLALVRDPDAAYNLNAQGNSPLGTICLAETPKSYTGDCQK